MFTYKVGFPFWKTLARMGVTLLVTVEVVYDDEAGVFVATSPNLRGMVAESDDVKGLFHEIHTSIDDLLYEELNKKVQANTKISGLALA